MSPKGRTQQHRLPGYHWVGDIKIWMTSKMPALCYSHGDVILVVIICGKLEQEQWHTCWGHIQCDWEWVGQGLHAPERKPIPPIHPKTSAHGEEQFSIWQANKGTVSCLQTKCWVINHAQETDNGKLAWIYGWSPSFFFVMVMTHFLPTGVKGWL